MPGFRIELRNLEAFEQHHWTVDETTENFEFVAGLQMEERSWPPKVWSGGPKGLDLVGRESCCRQAIDDPLRGVREPLLVTQNKLSWMISLSAS